MTDAGEKLRKGQAEILTGEPCFACREYGFPNSGLPCQRCGWAAKKTVPAKSPETTGEKLEKRIDKYYKEWMASSADDSDFPSFVVRAELERAAVEAENEIKHWNYADLTGQEAVEIGLANVAAAIRKLKE